MPEACRGCVIVHRSHPDICGILPVTEEADGAAFQWDPESKIFTIINSKGYPCYTYVTFSGSAAAVLDRLGREFEQGVDRSEDGEARAATTFVVVAEPRTAVRLGSIRASPTVDDFFALGLEQLHPAPTGAREPDEADEAPDYCFPLPGSHGPYLCTQGVGGHLTHFFPESYHAIDLRCAKSTPVLSIGDGFVKEIAESHSCGGVHAGNLAHWNSVTLVLDSGLIVDYLHILPNSASVNEGDFVSRGQVLCESGDIGFAPEPHLHVELHSASDPDGPSLPLSFGRGASRFVPVAGAWYSPEGEVPAPPGQALLPPPRHPEPPCSQRPGGVKARRRRTAAPRFGCMAVQRKLSRRTPAAVASPKAMPTTLG